MSPKKNKGALVTKYAFARSQKLGLPSAEQEIEFQDLFLDTPTFDALKDITNPECILIGRTGTGKSALIRRITETQPKVKRISPEEMSIRFLSNSTILDYLRSVGVNLNFFYKILWKHVFIIELIKLYVGDNEQRRATILERFKEKITGEQKAKKMKALSYLEEFSTDFWEATEIRIKSFENKLETGLSSELGVKPNVFSASVSEISKQIQSEASEVKHKAEKVINELQAEKLIEIINIFKNDIFTDYQKRYFIVVDDLDKDWVSQQIIYDLISSMIEVVQEFQINFKGVKIILAIRDNIHMLSIDNEHRGGQREKFASLDIHLTWTKEDLLALLNKRLKVLSNGKLSTDNLFEREYKKEGIEYILDRTYMRPRALISFVNKIIEQADKKTQFSQHLVKRAELNYSIDRFHAIEDEWRENYGNLGKICRFLTGTINNKPISSLSENDFELVYLEEGFADNFKGHLKAICIDLKSEKIELKKFIQELLYILFQVGIIGIKTPNKHLCFYYDQDELITKDDFSDGSKFHVHPALYSYFKVNTSQQAVDSFT